MCTQINFIFYLLKRYPTGKLGLECWTLKIYITFQIKGEKLEIRCFFRLLKVEQHFNALYTWQNIERVRVLWAYKYFLCCPMAPPHCPPRSNVSREEYPFNIACSASVYGSEWPTSSNPTDSYLKFFKTWCTILLIQHSSSASILQ